MPVFRPSPARFAAVACLALVGAASPAARAQADAERATARSLGGEGQEALDAKDYKTADDRFRRANNLVHAPTLMLGLARALAGEGKDIEAQETYNRILREGVAPGAPDAFRRALADAKKEVDHVSAKIGGVTITVRSAAGADVPNPKVTLDGLSVHSASLGVRRSIDPGSHVVQASADGFKPAELRFDVAEAGSATETLTLEVEAAPPAPTEVIPPATASPAADHGPSGSAAVSSGLGLRAALPWIALGIGGAGLAVGAVAGILAMGKHSDLVNDSAHCHDTTCDPSQQGNIDAYHTLGTVSTIGFVAGGVGVAAWVVLLVTQPKAEGAARAQPPSTSVRVTPVVGIGSFVVAGQF